MNFSDLRYLSLEGGGGKGAVYLGAIAALEKRMHENWEANLLLKTQGDEILNTHDVLKSSKAHGALLDYYNLDNELKIKGIAGASAGAITAFPLALGLTSGDIETILEGYQFEKEFMSNSLHEGKYRMVGKDAKGKCKILVAEDRLKKLGEDHIEPFKFTAVMAELNGVPKKKVGRNWLKAEIRKKVVSFTFQTILNGFLNLYEPINEFIKDIKKKAKITTLITSGEIDKVENEIELGPFSITFIQAFDTIANQLFSLSGKILKSPIKLSNSGFKIIKSLLLKLLPRKIKGFMPRDKMIGAISNIIWDRGVYAGFEVREFFFKILLLSLSKDTHFRRNVIKQNAFENIGISTNDILSIEGCIKKFKIVENDEYEPTLKKLSLHLAEELTFSRLYSITGVKLSCCVSNGTTSQPIYFSEYFTPNYPVLEAMGASMTFPVAFKPVYNEANVLLDKWSPALDIRIQSTDFVSRASTKSGNQLYKESFSQSDFSKYHNVILAYIKEQTGSSFSLNSNLSFRSYLPYLRAIIDTDDFKKEFEYKNTNSKKTVSYSSSEIRKLAYFFYNSTFKGLHVDGGVTNNLPIAVHTFISPKEGDKPYQQLQDLNIKKNVLSLKLDSSFPQDLKTDILKEIDRLTKERNIAVEAFYERLNEPNFIPIKTLLVYRVKSIAKKKFNSSLDKKVLEKIIEELKEEYKRDRKGFTPWNKQIPITSAVFSSLSFGFDQGQIEDIQDNENIIPLYCFGLAVFDFDLTSKKLSPLVDIAKKEAGKSIDRYFD